MLNTKRKINLETIYDDEKKNTVSLEYTASNPIEEGMTLHSSFNLEEYFNSEDYLRTMVEGIIADEFPSLKNNSLLCNLVMDSLKSNMGTVQSIKNVLLYSRENSIKTIDDVFFKDGDVHIKCSV